jgi:hypothetical protein
MAGTMLQRTILTILCLLMTACYGGIVNNEASTEVATEVATSGATWFISPQTGSDANPGTRARPLRTWAHLETLWGTDAPHHRQSTSITFLTSHTDNTDPVIFHPYLENGAFDVIQGEPRVVATGTLAAVTAKDRATGQLLQADLGPQAAAGMVLVDTTQNAKASVYANVAGNVWSLTQSLAPVAIPAVSSTFPAEVDTFADGDAFVLYQPVEVNIVDVSSTVVDYNATFNNVLYIYNLSVFDPSGATDDNIYRGAHVWMIEAETERAVYRTSTTNDQYELTINSYNDGGWYDGSGSGEFDAIVGGCITGADQVIGSARTAFDGDVILTPDVLSFPDGVTLGLVNIGTTLTMGGGRSTLIDVAGGYGPTANGQALWGPGGVQMLGDALWNYKPDYGAAGIMFFMGGITMNGGGQGTTACSLSAGTIYCGIPITIPNLDTPSGPAGFGGDAFNPGGAAVVGTEG